jgi:hypothetical protein
MIRLAAISFLPFDFCLLNPKSEMRSGGPELATEAGPVVDASAAAGAAFGSRAKDRVGIVLGDLLGRPFPGGDARDRGVAELQLSGDVALGPAGGE